MNKEIANNENMKAYLIGNGASIPYGSPLGSDVFKRAFELFYERLEKSHHDNCFHRLKDNITRVIAIMDDLKELLAWGNLNLFHMGKYRKKFEDLMNPNISYSERANFYREIKDYFAKYKIWELLPKTVEYYKDKEHHGFKDLKSKRSTLLEGRGNFFDRIAEFSFKTIYFAIEYSKDNPDYYTNFVKAISNSFEDTVIINLNYDNLLERVLKKNFMGIVEYGFGDEIKCFPSLQCDKKTGQRVLLFKPHGSFDFFFCNKCKSITISEDVPLEYFQDPFSKKQCKNPDCNKRNLPNFFIPYTDVTLPIRYKDILNSIIEKMKQILESIDEITVIGYSFSEYDDDLIDKHLKFIFENRKVIVVAKDVSENEKICSRLRKFGINVENSGLNGFADFIRHIPNNFL